ncbi:MAG: hypothetical protein R2762_09530 [Bryobacteraceae bacterium]
MDSREQCRLDYRRRSLRIRKREWYGELHGSRERRRQPHGTITVAGQTFTVTQGGGQPVVVGMSPASGTGSSGLFTFNFSDPDGFSDLNILNVLISQCH